MSGYETLLAYSLALLATGYKLRGYLEQYKAQQRAKELANHGGALLAHHYNRVNR